MTWGSDNSKEEPESQEEELPWVVIPTKAEAPRTAEQEEQVPNESNPILQVHINLDRARSGRRGHDTLH